MSCPLLPFHVNVTHFLPADADVIEDDITGVPDDAAQEEPKQIPKHSVPNIHAFYRLFNCLLMLNVIH